MLKEWSRDAERDRAEILRDQRELDDLRARVKRSYTRAAEALGAMRNMRRMFTRIRAQSEGRTTPSNSPHALASRALYTEHGCGMSAAEAHTFISNFLIPQNM
jgi:hypothetical protein